MYLTKLSLLTMYLIICSHYDVLIIINLSFFFYLCLNFDKVKLLFCYKNVSRKCLINKENDVSINC